MKQVLQNMRTGETTVEEVPEPGLGRNRLLIQTKVTLISAGTERMLVEFGKGSLLAKARSQPDKVQQVLEKIKTDGFLPTLEAVFSKLDEPLPLGYCNAGVVLDVGPGVSDFKKGDRVISNGPHAELVSVPTTLCAKIPDGVSDEQAVFTVLTSVGLQGIRLAQPTLGETVVVIGLGLIGLVTAQLLKANGCRVIGVDVNSRRLALAREYGVLTVDVGQGADSVTAVMSLTAGRGADAVLITASAKTDDIVHQAAAMSRKRGRIVLVGVVGLNIRRDDFYEKELSFQVSCSYGPGRYDEKYESGEDYPLGFVRWTEQRNFEAVLESLRSGDLVVDNLITHRLPLDNAPQAYQTITSDGSALGVLLQYAPDVARGKTVAIASAVAAPAGKAQVGIIGAGNFSKMTLMPGLRRIGRSAAWIADLNGASAKHLAKKFGAGKATSDYKQILADPAVQAVFIAVRHNLHARFLLECLQAGKHVLVEKPLALTVDELRQILQESARHADRLVMVGFNRRFSPHLQAIKKALTGRSEPLSMNMLVNAGYAPPKEWVNDPVIGGGRIVGEGCHFIDLMVYLTGSKVASVSAAMAGEGAAVHEDKMAISLSFEDGSVGSVNYFANGAKSFPKERLTVFSDGRVVEMDNFRRTTGYGFKGFKKLKTMRQDKGHVAEFAAFLERIEAGGPAPIALGELLNVTLASFAAMTSAIERRTVCLAQEYSSLLDSHNS